MKEENLMQNKHSNSGKYLLAALIGVGLGGFAVAATTRAVPKMISGMMAGMKEHCQAEGMCRQMTEGTEQPCEQACCQA